VKGSLGHNQSGSRDSGQSPLIIRMYKPSFLQRLLVDDMFSQIFFQIAVCEFHRAL
jgi:hypothetical protein